MSDIKDSIVVTGSQEVAPEAPITPVETETPLTAEGVGNTEGLAVGDSNPVVKDEAKGTDDKVAPETPEDKSKDERREEGSKVERKIGKVNKEKAKESRRADKAETELKELKKRYADFEKAKGEQDLDSMSFDDRVSQVAKDSYNETAMKSEAEKLQTEISTGQADDWNGKVAQFKETHADYEEVVKSLEVPLEIAKSIKKMKGGVELAYKLAKDPETSAQLVNASPMEAAMILVELKQQGSPVVQPSAVIPQEPPKAPVLATPSTSLTPQQQNKPRVKYPSQMSMGDYINHRREKGTLR